MIKSADEFYRLRMSTDIDECSRAAEETACDEVWLEVIERYPTMKIWVVNNKTVPVTILEILAKDSDVVVREWVARKRKLTRTLFELLSKDPEPSVRSCINSNPTVPVDILTHLTTDADPWVAENAKEWLKRRSSEG